MIDSLDEIQQEAEASGIEFSYKFDANLHEKVADSIRKSIDAIPALKNYWLDGLITDEVSDEFYGILNPSDRDNQLHSDYRQELRTIFKKINTWLHDKRMYDEKKLMHAYSYTQS